MRVAADHPVFLGQREIDIVIGHAELLDLSGGAGLLRAEIVGRDAKDDQSLIAVLPPERLQIAILRCVTAKRGGVDNKDRVAGPGGQR